MAHFRGILQGNRGQASRLGSKASGMKLQAQSWQGRAIIAMYHNEKTGKDMLQVELTTHSNGAGASPNKIVYFGPIDGSEVSNA